MSTVAAHEEFRRAELRSTHGGSDTCWWRCGTAASEIQTHRERDENKKTVIICLVKDHKVRNNDSKFEKKL